MGELGTRFRLARENKQVTLRQAERDTRIRLKYLQALEDQDMASLPPEVYVKGFVRNYASYLGLDPNEMLTLYRAALGQEPVSLPQLQAEPDSPAVIAPAKPTPAT
ncbi:MAG: helix-turn-helix domain-containing protein, partial [Chloroflexi bacterium]|nr:helix-turn-helix domain-containing protein [Chloroflexota bacterium]